MAVHKIRDECWIFQLDTDKQLPIYKFTVYAVFFSTDGSFEWLCHTAPVSSNIMHRISWRWSV